MTTDTLGEATVGVASNAPGTVDVSKFEYVCKTWDNEYVDTSTVTLTPLYSVKKFATFNKLYK